MDGSGKPHFFWVNPAVSLGVRYQENPGNGYRDLNGEYGREN